MEKSKKALFCAWVISVCLIAACRKSGFLDAKPSSNLVVPSALSDFDAILDNQNVMAESGTLGILSSDEFFLKPDFWATLSAKERNAYIWASDIYQGQGVVADWNYPYQQIFYANVVLTGLEKADRSADPASYDFIKGWALFARAYAFYNLVSVFALPYDSATSGTDAGIPIRLSPEVTELEKRASVQASYDQILSDLHTAEPLLPEGLQVENRNRPCRAAAAAMLARVYLAMRRYPEAGAAADSSLELYGKLIDFNTGNMYGNRNDETLYQSNGAKSSNALFYLQYGDVALVDTVLFSLYADNDLRKTILYRPSDSGYQNLVLTYDGFGFVFTGLTSAESLLIRAESYARAGNIDAALADLNALLVDRYAAGTFTPETASDAREALDKILTERRKELAFRGVRFTDLRRLNKEEYNITITRLLNGTTYTLEPGSPKYVLPIPPDEIALSQISQNER